MPPAPRASRIAAMHAPPPPPPAVDRRRQRVTPSPLPLPLLLLTQVRKISVKQVTSPIIFDNMKTAVKGGLYDPAFGPMDPKSR